MALSLNPHFNVSPFNLLNLVVPLPLLPLLLLLLLPNPYDILLAACVLSITGMLMLHVAPLSSPRRALCPIRGVCYHHDYSHCYCCYYRWKAKMDGRWRVGLDRAVARSVSLHCYWPCLLMSSLAGSDVGM